MWSPNKFENFPIGSGSEFQKERQKETLPALEVKNTAIWINPSFEETMPFKIELGKPAKLGIFLTAHPEIYPEEKEWQAMIAPEEISGRSVLLGSFLFKDREGRLYRDVDLKGTGMFQKMPDEKYVVGEVRKRQDNNPYRAKGLTDYAKALNSIDRTEQFLKLEIRTNRIIAILDLEEIIDKDGNKISIEKAKEAGVVPEAMHPVIMVRAFNTKERIDYTTHISNENQKNRAVLAINDARMLVAEELHQNPSDFSLGNYLEWFAKTLGEQIAKLRKLGFYHSNLHPQNITLDCRIADLEGVDTVEDIISGKEKRFTYGRDNLRGRLGGAELAPEILYRSEFDGAENSLNVFLDNIEKLTQEINKEDKQHYLDIYKNSYNKELKSKKDEDDK